MMVNGSKNVFKNRVEIIKELLEMLGLYLCAFFVVITNGGIWAYNLMTDLTFWDEYDDFLVILFILIVLLFIFKPKTNVSKTCVERIVFVLTCSAIYFVNHEEGYHKTRYKQYFLIPLILFLALFWLVKNKEIIWKAITDVVCVFSVISLFFYVFGTWLHLISPMNHVIREWGSWGPNPIPNYYFLYYQAQVTHHGNFDLWRNCGIFAEAPMYNMMLCISLAAEVFLYRRKKGRKAVIAILIITIVSTFSTTGFLFLALLCAFALINSARFISFCKKHIKIAIAVAALFLGAATLMVIIKLQTPQGSGSTAVRMDHTFTCLKIWKEYFLFGYGWLNDGLFMQLSKHPSGLSVGLPYFLACGGTILGSLIFVPYVISIVNAIKTRDFKLLSFSTLFIMLFVFTAVIRYPIVTLYIAYTAFCCDKNLTTTSRDKYAD